MKFFKRVKYFASFMLISFIFTFFIFGFKIINAEDEGLMPNGLEDIEEIDPNNPNDLLSPCNLEDDAFPSELQFQINESKVKYQKYKYSSTDNLDGMTFAIVIEGFKTAMVPTYRGGEVKHNGIPIFNGYWMETASFDTVSLMNAVGLQSWLFEKGENGGYYIRNLNSDYYLSTKMPNILILNSDNSKSEYDSSIRNRPASLVLSKDKTEFKLVNNNGNIQILDDSLGWTSNIDCYWKNNKFVTTTWKANSYLSLYYSDPFTLSYDYPNTTFDQKINNYGIITKENGETIIGNNSNRLLPNGKPIDKTINTYLLEKPLNFDEVTGNYVVTNINVAYKNQDIDARNGVIAENRKNARSGILNIDDYICPGTQFKFMGYLAEDIDGNEVLLGSGTTLNWGYTANDLIFKAINEDGSEIPLKYGQQIKTKWIYISSLVSFHIDYTGTILADDIDIERRTSEEELTWAVAIGTIYNGRPLGNNTTMSTSVDEIVRKEFVVYDHNPNELDTEITLELYADIPHASADKVWVNAKHNNLENIQSHFFRYVKNSRDDVEFMVSPNNGSTTILNKYNSSNENYAVRWYQVTPDSGVGNINIKGVLVAKTSKMTITSNIDGLPQEKVEELLKRYNIRVDIDRLGNNYLNF